jgi:hypothetical protein
VSHLEARYRRVVEQNRALYNEVQDLKGSIRVYCRIRWGLGGLKCEGLLQNAGAMLGWCTVRRMAGRGTAALQFPAPTALRATARLPPAAGR